MDTLRETPEQIFTRILKENNLTAQLLPPKTRYMQDGAVLVEQPLLQVSFTQESQKEEELAQKATEVTAAPEENPVVEPAVEPEAKEEDGVAGTQETETNESSN